MEELGRQAAVGEELVYQRWLEAREARVLVAAMLEVEDALGLTQISWEVRQQARHAVHDRERAAAGRADVLLTLMGRLA